MQPSLHPVSPFLLWPRRAESPSGSTGQSKQHSPYWTIKEDAIAAQKMDIGMEHIWRRMELDEAQCFRQDSEGVLWFKDCLVVPKTLSFAARSWMRLIAPDTPSTPEPTKCIKTWRRISGGWEWKVKLQDMCQCVTGVKGSRPIIWGQLEICNHWAFPSGSGKTSAWTKSWVCLTLRVVTTRYESLWTAWPSRLTLYPYPLCIGSNNMPSSTCHTLSLIMVSRRPLSLIEGLSLWHDFGNNYTTVWAPILFEVQPVTPRQTGKLTEWINQIIEDMLRACALSDGPTWDKHLPLAEFTYNNSYQESIKMSPFEALYGWPCHTLLSWSELGKWVIFGPDIVQRQKRK
jgi:hypothetical protein